MSTSANTPFELFNDLNSVELSTLVSKAAMLERIDQKYIVQLEDLQKLISELKSEFDILEINNSRRFTYETRYFDGEQYNTYLDHLRGRRKRAKVRIRRYVHSGECFLEVKLKDRRGMTIKHRKPVDPNEFNRMEQDSVEFIEQNHLNAYGRNIHFALKQALDVRYDRITLIAKKGGERLTIDGNIHFSTPNAQYDLSDQVFIVETKSRNGNGLADRVLRRLHQHPTKHCSKYCIGLSVVNKNLKINPFRPAIRKLLGREYLQVETDRISNTVLNDNDGDTMQLKHYAVQ